MDKLKRTSFLSPSRIAVIASHTFTQLVRMKVFYFLIIFALLFWALKQFVFGDITGGDNAAAQELRLLKSTSFFAMNLFASVMALAATALLIPKDIEDRTLYTILCKPVPRLDYLIGKLFGVLALIFVSLLIMDLLVSSVLYVNTAELVARDTKLLSHYPAEVVAKEIDELKKLGYTHHIHYAVLTIFLKAAVIASIALLISTFSTSTIFTLILTIIVVLIGMIQADAREYALKAAEHGDDSIVAKFSSIIAIIFPDFQFMSIDDGVIDGRPVPLILLVKIAIVALFYVSIYTVLSWFTFRKKEF